MNARRINADSHTRLMGVPELTAYLSLGRAAAVEFARAAGAEIKIGRRCLYDRNVIDHALDDAKGDGK